MKSSRVLLAFLGGLATGAVLGVLFAPDTGKNTRDKLSYQLDKYMKKLKEMLGQEIDGNEVSGRIKPSPDISKQDYKKAEELLREVESLLDDIKTKGPAGNN
jgi:gas vesicle protein